MRILPRVLLFVAKLFPERLITRGGGDPRAYLRRWYVCGDPGALKYFPCGVAGMKWWQRLLTWLPCIYLHRFESSDADEELHNHPWAAKSLILWGGYMEVRRGEATRLHEPGDINVITPTTFHRVLLLDEECWSLLLVGEKSQSWGFWNPRTNDYVPWKIHRARQEREAMSKAKERSS